MLDSPAHSPKRLQRLLTQLTTTNQTLSHSLAHLTDKAERLSQNLDWVDGRITILSEYQNRLVEPETMLTQAIQEAGPDLMATLMMQRSQFSLQARALGDNLQQDWLEHSCLRQPKSQSD
jgi:hypothetical protein